MTSREQGPIGMKENAKICFKNSCSFLRPIKTESCKRAPSPGFLESLRKRPYLCSERCRGRVACWELLLSLESGLRLMASVSSSTDDSNLGTVRLGAVLKVKLFVLPVWSGRGRRIKISSNG